MKFKTSFSSQPDLFCIKARRTPFPVREYSLINKKHGSIIKVGVVKEPTF